MLQPPERLRFLLKAAEGFRVAHAGLDDLESHRTSRMLLFRFVNSTHPSLADQPQNSVTANDSGTSGDDRRLFSWESDLGISEVGCGPQPQFDRATRATSAQSASFRESAI